MLNLVCGDVVINLVVMNVKKTQKLVSLSFSVHMDAVYQYHQSHLF